MRIKPTQLLVFCPEKKGESKNGVSALVKNGLRNHIVLQRRADMDNPRKYGGVPNRNYAYPAA